MGEDENIRSVNFVRNTITSLNGKLHVEWNKPDGLNYVFYIRNHNIQIKFGREVMDDFNVACQGSKKSDNYRALDNLIRFRIYIALGNAGLIPNFSVSKPLLDEERDWLRNFKTHFEGTDELNDCFYNGLRELSSFLEEISKKYGPNEDMQEEIRHIRSLLDYYEKEHDFEEDEASEKSLGFLKAAAVCMIIRKEREKQSITIPRISRRKDQEIYSIVAALRENPFPQIEMPDCIYDYAKYVKSSKNESEHEYMSEKLDLLDNWVPFASNKQVFLAHRFNETSLRDSAVTKLTKQGFSVKEGKVEDLGYISDDILDKIKTSGFFLALLTPSKKFEEGRYSTSTWVLMEIGSAIAFGRKVLVLAEDSVDQEEYAGKLQRDCQYETFDRSNFENKLKVVITRIKKEWEKSSSSKL